MMTQRTETGEIKVGETHDQNTPVFLRLTRRPDSALGVELELSVSEALQTASALLALAMKYRK